MFVLGMKTNSPRVLFDCVCLSGRVRDCSRTSTICTILIFPPTTGTNTGTNANPPSTNYSSLTKSTRSVRRVDWINVVVLVNWSTYQPQNETQRCHRGKFWMNFKASTRILLLVINCPTVFPIKMKFSTTFLMLKVRGNIQCNLGQRSWKLDCTARTDPSSHFSLDLKP